MSEEEKKEKEMELKKEEEGNEKKQRRRWRGRGGVEEGIEDLGIIKKRDERRLKNSLGVSQ